MVPPRKYVRLDDFNRFLSNDFWHLARMVKWNTWMLLAILAALIARLVTSV